MLNIPAAGKIRFLEAAVGARHCSSAAFTVPLEGRAEVPGLEFASAVHPARPQGALSWEAPGGQEHPNQGNRPEGFTPSTVSPGPPEKPRGVTLLERPAVTWQNTSHRPPSGKRAAMGTHVTWPQGLMLMTSKPHSPPTTSPCCRHEVSWVQQLGPELRAPSALPPGRMNRPLLQMAGPRNQCLRVKSPVPQIDFPEAGW